MNIDLYCHASNGVYGIATVDSSGMQASEYIGLNTLAGEYTSQGGIVVAPSQGWTTTPWTFTVPTQSINYITTDTPPSQAGLGAAVYQWGDPSTGNVVYVYHLSTPVKVDSLVFSFWSPDTGFKSSFKNTYFYVSG
jgi:hypothetical protein